MQPAIAWCLLLTAMLGGIAVVYGYEKQVIEFIGHSNKYPLNTTNHAVSKATTHESIDCTT